MTTKQVRKRVSELKFSLLSPEEIKKISSAKIVTPELYDIDGYPVDGGLMDLRLGAINPGVRCRTCGGRLKECNGHPGRIELARPILHYKYIPLIEKCLRSFCQKCGKLMVDDKSLKKYSPTKRLKKAKDSKKCPHCSAEQEKIKLDKPLNFYRGKKRIFPTEIREMLVNLPDEELRKAGIDYMTCRPEWAVLTMLLVPSVTVRPSIILESGECSEDDLTHKLSDIIRANQRLWENLSAGAPEVIIEDLWDLLQFHITTFFDNTVSGVPPARHRSGQPLKTITERIKGKEGRIRKNIAGKRVNYSARTVISPDPQIKINEVGIPYEIAKVVTVSEIVNDLNIDKIKKLIEKGSKEYPGANYVIRPDKKRKKIAEELKEEILEELTPGYVVERHLQDGDVVLFNRHPSLHKGSLMSHFVRVLPGKTFRLHPSACFPYNADFDGDEMNIHSPQTEEARAEAKVLLDVKANLMSPKNNTNWIGCIKDAITGQYLLSKTELTKKYANQLLFDSGINEEIKTKSISGSDLFSKILPKINFSNNSFAIEKGKLTRGNLDKSAFSEEDGELIKELDKEVGRDEAFDTIQRAFNLGKNYLDTRGITACIDDFNLSEDVIKRSEEIMRKAKEKTEKIIETYNKGEMEIIPGKTLEESREINILRALNEIRTKIGVIVKENFPEDNPVSDMIKSGGGGKMLNVTQMACSVGQQAINGKRIGFGYTERTLSCYKKGDLSPRARGFVYSPLMKGLEPDEFFFSAITGRDSLMDSALRIPKSGYLYRRLSNALQDIKAEYDQTVRDSNNSIIQFRYGLDSKDVSKLHLKDGTISPGEAVGLIAAQSFGESSTQMALNAFHFAGVSEMQVTTGLTRIIEIFDARKNPSSPKMKIYLKKEKNNEKDARVFAEKIKEVMLKEVASEINIDFSNKRIEVHLDNNALRQTHITSKKVVDVLNNNNKIKAKENSGKISVNVKDSSFKEMYKIKEKLKDAIISGVKGVKQVLVTKDKGSYKIETLGTNLKEIMKLKEVNVDKLSSNDIHEVAKIFGIEAARQLIVDETQEVLDSQGIDIDKRHLMLVADAMTAKGEVKGITRTGIISQKSSILARATFETPDKQFINSTIDGTKDELTSVIENLVLNQPVPVGTGLPGLLVKVIGPLSNKN